MNDKIFAALASTQRRKILAYLSEGELSVGELAGHFQMSMPSLSKHLKVLEGAGLVAADKRGQFVYYTMVQEGLRATLTGFLQAICPVSQVIKRNIRRQSKTNKN